MKKPVKNHKESLEHPAIEISATLNEQRLLKNLVERLAAGRYTGNEYFETVEPGWQAINSSSLEAYVSVDVNLSEEKEFIHVPLITCFLFTCTKEKNKKYTMNWVNSLS